MFLLGESLGGFSCGPRTSSRRPGATTPSRSPANANTNLAYVANGLNQGKQADATVYTFDANGNLTSDGWFTFTYDLENKLVSALPINAGVRTLNYDPLNRLDIYNPGTPKRFIYDGDEVVAELDSSGNIIGRYVRGDAPDEIITGYTSSNPTARGWYHLDQRNSVIAVTDPNGIVTVVNRYDEYGMPQGGNYGTFQYTGQMWLGEIGVYNYKNRMYWPNERPGGRFMQAEPVGPIDSASLYQYALNDPVNLVDPSGRAIVITACTRGTIGVGDGAGLSCITPLDYERLLDRLDRGERGTNEGSSGGGDRPIVITAKIKPKPAPPTRTSCIAHAIGEGLLEGSIDSIGLIPGGGGARSIVRRIGNRAGYRGIVADNFGRSVVHQAEIGGGIYGGSTALAKQDWLGLGLDVAGFIPGANDIVTVAHLSYDAYRTWKRAAACR